MSGLIEWFLCSSIRNWLFPLAISIKLMRTGTPLARGWHTMSASEIQLSGHWQMGIQQLGIDHRPVAKYGHSITAGCNSSRRFVYAKAFSICGFVEPGLEPGSQVQLRKWIMANGCNQLWPTMSRGICEKWMNAGGVFFCFLFSGFNLVRCSCRFKSVVTMGWGWEWKSKVLVYG